jgi:hypothetical protein
MQLLQELHPITKIKNIGLMAARVVNLHDKMYYALVGLPLEYAKQVPSAQS